MQLCTYACLLGPTETCNSSLIGSDSWRETSRRRHWIQAGITGGGCGIDKRFGLQALHSEKRLQRPRRKTINITYNMHIIYIFTYVYLYWLHGKNEIWGCLQRWQHRRKIDVDKNRSSRATTIECGAQCANYSATHKVNQRKTLKHRNVHKDAQSTTKHNAIWRSFVPLDWGWMGRPGRSWVGPGLGCSGAGGW